MGLNVTGGALQFEGVINADQFFAELRKMEDELKKVAASGAGANQKTVDDIQKQFSGLTKTLESGQIIISESSAGFGESILKMASGISVGGLALEGLNIGIALAIKYLNEESEATKRAAENMKLLNDVVADSNKKLGEQINELKILYDVATDVNNSMADRIEAVQALKLEYPDTFANLKNEVILNGKARQSYDELRDSIIATSRARAAKDKLDVIAAERLDIEFQKQKINNAVDNENRRARDRSKTVEAGGEFFTETVTKEKEVGQNEERRLAAIKIQNDRDKLLEDQAKFLTDFVGGEKKIAEVIQAGIKTPKVKALKENTSKSFKSDKPENPFTIELADLTNNLKTALSLVVDSKTKSLNVEIDFLEKKKQLQEKYGKDEGDTTLQIAEKNKQLKESLLKDASAKSQSDLNIIISGIQVKLATVEQGSEAELQLKRDLIDNLALLDVAQYNAAVRTETEIQSKVLEINAKANQRKRELDERYYKDKLKNDLSTIENAGKAKSIDQDAIIKNPLSSSNEIFAAKIKQFTDALETINKKQARIQQDIDAKHGNIEELKNQIKELGNKAKQTKNDIDLANLIESLEHLERIASGLGKLQSGLSQLSSGARELDKDFSEIIGTLSNVASGVESAISSFKLLKESQGKKDLFGEISGGLGIAGAAIGVVSTIVGIFTKAAEQRKKAKEEADRFITGVVTGEISVNDEYRKRLVIQSQLNKLKLEGLKSESDALTKNKLSTQDDFSKVLALIQKERKILRNDRGVQFSEKEINRSSFLTSAASLSGKSFDDLQKLFLTGQLEGKAKELFQTLEKLKKEGVDIDAALAQNKKNAQETFTGTTSDSILDSIVQGFADGKKATADFADNFQEVMKKAILNSLKYQALEKPLKEFYEKFALDAESGGNLDTTEISQLQTMYDTIIKNAGTQFQQLQSLTNINFANSSGAANSLKGAIQTQLTEQTGSVLAGTANGMRMNQIEMIGIMNNQFATINKIEANTALLNDTNRYLLKTIYLMQTEGIKVK